MRQNLSLEQAPPISVPFRFFITAPLFGVAAALLIVFAGPDILSSRWSPFTLALTHLLTLGFMGLAMCGAIMQMLPVVGGAVVKRPLLVGGTVHVLLVAGILALTTGLLLPSTIAMRLAMVFLGLGFVVFAAAVFEALMRRPVSSDTIDGMRLAIVSLLITAALGLVLLSAFAWSSLAIDLPRWTNVHLVWGILGWTGLLVVSVAYQVVPMFQLTPRYPGWMTRYLVRALFAAILFWSALYLSGPYLQDLPANIWMLVCIGAFAAFSTATLWLQFRRKRRTEDITVWFWRLGMGSVLVAALGWLAATLFPGLALTNEFPFLLGLCLLVGFAFSVINGMLYKIVPFLIWFHLQHRRVGLTLKGTVTVPNVKRILPTHAMKRQFHAHLIAIGMLLAAILGPGWVVYAAGVALTVSSAMLWYNLLRSLRIYVEYDRYLRHSGE